MTPVVCVLLRFFGLGQNLDHPSPHFNDAKMARFCTFAPSLSLWRVGGWIIVSFYFVKDCWFGGELLNQNTVSHDEPNSQQALLLLFFLLIMKRTLYLPFLRCHTTLHLSECPEKAIKCPVAGCTAIFCQKTSKEHVVRAASSHAVLQAG